MNYFSDYCQNKLSQFENIHNLRPPVQTKVWSDSTYAG